ncbi:hypothetical protein ACOME3_005210 [Neoechinorhynchus agilis]
MNHLLDRIPNMAVYLDDKVISGENDKNHLSNLRRIYGGKHEDIGNELASRDYKCAKDEIVINDKLSITDIEETAKGFSWGRRVRELMRSPKELIPYALENEVMVAYDASESGFGAVLLQQELSRIRSNRLRRWTVAMMKYNYEIEFVRGNENVYADALSRIPEPRDGTVESRVEAIDLVDCDDSRIINAEVLKRSLKKDTVLPVAYHHSPDLRTYFEMLIGLRLRPAVFQAEEYLRLIPGGRVENGGKRFRQPHATCWPTNSFHPSSPIEDRIEQSIEPVISSKINNCIHLTNQNSTNKCVVPVCARVRTGIIGFQGSKKQLEIEIKIMKYAIRNARHRIGVGMARTRRCWEWLIRNLDAMDIRFLENYINEQCREHKKRIRLKHAQKLWNLGGVETCLPTTKERSN